MDAFADTSGKNDTFDKLTGQFLNFDKSMGLSTTKGGMKKLKELAVEGTPLLIIQNGKSFGALVINAMKPTSFITKRESITQFLL